MSTESQMEAELLRVLAQVRDRSLKEKAEFQAHMRVVIDRHIAGMKPPGLTRPDRPRSNVVRLFAQESVPVRNRALRGPLPKGVTSIHKNRLADLDDHEQRAQKATKDHLRQCFGMVAAEIRREIADIDQRARAAQARNSLAAAKDARLAKKGATP